MTYPAALRRIAENLTTHPADMASARGLLNDIAGALEWRPITSAPMDGRELLCLDAETGLVRVCRPKLFPRPIADGGDMNAPREGDRWEYFRDDTHAPGHTWSMTPTHWQPLPEVP